MALLLDDRHVSDLLDPEQALVEVERAFRLLAEGAAVNEPRRRIGARGTTLNVMSALAPSLDAVAVKSYPVVRSDVSQASVILVTLYSHSTGECLGIVQGDRLGQLRTAATTALATKLAARPDATTLTVFGTGYQAMGQVHACTATLPSLRTVHVVGRDLGRQTDFVAALSAELPGLTITATDAERAVRAADVVMTATAAREPLFNGHWLRPGAHINAIGSNQAEARELDATTLQRAARVIVDDHEVASLESGDLLRNHFPIDNCVELGHVVCGEQPGRLADAEITIFESHGLALLDLVCGLHVLGAARASGIGHDVDWPMPMLHEIRRPPTSDRSVS